MQTTTNLILYIIYTVYNMMSSFGNFEEEEIWNSIWVFDPILKLIIGHKTTKKESRKYLKTSCLCLHTLSRFKKKKGSSFLALIGSAHYCHFVCENIKFQILKSSWNDYERIDDNDKEKL